MEHVLHPVVEFVEYHGVLEHHLLDQLNVLGLDCFEKLIDLFLSLVTQVDNLVVARVV